MPKSPGYPFEPRSTATLAPGQFWAVPLLDGRFGCGRVLQLNAAHIPTPSRAFLGGVQDWIGDAPPTGEQIAGSTVIRVGVMHIRAISQTGGAILGCRPLAADGIELPQLLSAMGGDGTMLLRGAEPIRPATPDEWRSHPSLSFWGYDYITQLAERLASGKLAPAG